MHLSVMTCVYPKKKSDDLFPAMDSFLKFVSKDVGVDSNLKKFYHKKEGITIIINLVKIL